jgi:hypothetical protein
MKCDWCKEGETSPTCYRCKGTGKIEMKPYLVQRLNKPYKGDVTGPLQGLAKYGLQANGLPENLREIMAQVCVFDYMGSSEYEFGEIPKALRALAKASIELKQFSFTCPYEFKSWEPGRSKMGSKLIFVICKAKDQSDVIDAIKKMALGDEHCKERTECSGSFAESEYQADTLGWLDLVHHYMFFKDHDMFKNFCTLFGMGE